MNFSSPDLVNALLDDLAERLAIRLRASTVEAEKSDWIPAELSPLGYRKTLDLAKAGTLKSSKPSKKKVLISRASLNEYLSRHERNVPTETESEDLFAAGSK